MTIKLIYTLLVLALVAVVGLYAYLTANMVNSGCTCTLHTTTYIMSGNVAIPLDQCIQWQCPTDTTDQPYSHEPKPPPVDTMVYQVLVYHPLLAGHFDSYGRRYGPTFRGKATTSPTDQPINQPTDN